MLKCFDIIVRNCNGSVLYYVTINRIILMPFCIYFFCIGIILFIRLSFHFGDCFMDTDV